MLLVWRPVSVDRDRQPVGIRARLPGWMSERPVVGARRSPAGGPGHPRAVTDRPVIAALFVAADGPYAGLPDVEVWDVSREARIYPGPYRVVAHPPCERWGRYWGGGPSARVKRLKGDDGGCFLAALEAVRRFGGVLEHPAASSAWEAFGLKKPPRAGGWVVADWRGGWTCCVDQGHYGHRAQKATWLYANGVDLPTLRWGKARSGVRLDEGFHSAEERRRKVRTGVCKRMSKRECAITPLLFRDLLLSMVRTDVVMEVAG